MIVKVALNYCSNEDLNFFYLQDVVHISDLPVEIMRYIIQLFVLSDLDLRSLEQFAMVSLYYILFHLISVGL